LKTDINEKYVTQAWQSLIESVGEFNAENGESLRIIYPGKISDAPGSDFQDAVIKIDGQLTRGNIEIHVNSSNWRTHRHHRDSTYNRVVLHVVMWHDTPDNTELADHRVANIEDEIKVGDEITTKVIRNEDGKIALSRKAVFDTSSTPDNGVKRDSSNYHNRPPRQEHGPRSQNNSQPPRRKNRWE
jgi:hypothetical protein